MIYLGKPHSVTLCVKCLIMIDYAMTQQWWEYFKFENKSS